MKKKKMMNKKNKKMLKNGAERDRPVARKSEAFVGQRSAR